MTRNRLGWVLVITLLGTLVLAGADHVARDHVPATDAHSRTVMEDEVVEVVADRVIDGLTVVHVRDSTIYGIEDRFVHKSDDWGESFQEIGRLGRHGGSLGARARDLVLRRPLVRLLRRPEGARSLVVLPTSTVVVAYDRIYRLPEASDVAVPVDYPVEDFGPPLPHGITVDGEGQVFIGEYRTDGRPQAPRLLRGVDDGRTWEVCHAFPSGEVFHIHSVRYDPVADRVLVTTGDEDEESAIYEVQGDCEGLAEVGGGSQDWRVVSLVPGDTALVWGSDNSLTPAGPGIFVKERGERTPSRVHDLPTPSYYSTLLGDGTVVIGSTATAPHPDVPGPTDTTSLWISRDLQRWHHAFSLREASEEREWGPTRGQIALPTGTATSPYIFASPWYTERSSPQTIRLRLRWKDSARPPP